jgi:hypothetical protein
MNEQLKAQHRAIQMQAEAYKHRLDETVVNIEGRMNDLNKELTEYIEQFIPEELK